MTKEPVAILLGTEKRQAIEAVAERSDRDAASVIREAIDTYLDLHRWQERHIREGLRQADAGEFASDDRSADILDA